MKGTFNILDISSLINVKHLLISSTSSVYGSNKKFPFSENDRTDTQMSFYEPLKVVKLWLIPILIFTIYQ